MNKISYALERKSRFLGEQRNEPYFDTAKRVAQPKNGFGAKTSLQGQAWLGLERRDA